MKIAVIGAGISGLSAAYLLHRRYEIDLFEKAPYAGGHAHTVTAETPEGDVPVDTGFIVYNEANYPNFTRLLDELRVETQPSDMSFAVQSVDGGPTYSSRGIRGLLAMKRNVLQPAFHRMVRDIPRFNRLARAALKDGTAYGATLGEFLRRHRFSTAFARYYISPMSSAIWSAPPGATLDFPADVFFHFFHNHGLLRLRPDVAWRTIRGGSRRYVDAMTAGFRDRLHLNAPVRSVRRTADTVFVGFDDGPERAYDHVVLAAHADQALRLLTDPTAEEERLLARYPYQSNRTVLHDDTSVMPSRRAAWASWNVRLPARNVETETALTMSYHMNRLQGLPQAHPLFVTLNPASNDLSQARVFADLVYEHPRFNVDSFRLQPLLHHLNGINRTWFCGAYGGYGFHEDGLASGLRVARGLGVEWTP